MSADSDHNPLVTVVAVCYNHESFVEECLESIRKQTFQEFELIVVDDASTDGSAPLIDAWLKQNYPDARFMRNTANRGICVVLNMVLAATNGRYLAMISTDDAWEPAKLELQLNVFSMEGTGTAVVYSDASLMDVNSERLPGSFIQYYWPTLQPPSAGILDCLVTRNFIPAMATLIRTDAVRDVGGYDESLVYEDYDMWLRLAKVYGFTYLNAQLARYRIVPGSLNHVLVGIRRNALARSQCQIALKQLKATPLLPAHRARWVEYLGEEAFILYLGGDRRAAYYLGITAVQARDYRWAVVAVAAGLRLPKRLVEHLRSRF